jgi:hypothetical protein
MLLTLIHITLPDVLGNKAGAGPKLYRYVNAEYAKRETSENVLRGESFNGLKMCRR